MGDEPRGLLQFRMLGPLEAWRGEMPLRLGGKRQRALLALLLVHANELVRTEQLVDQLLREGVSDSALNTARVAVSRLRRLLENGNADQVLVTQAGGYCSRLGLSSSTWPCLSACCPRGERCSPPPAGERHWHSRSRAQ